MKGHERMNSIIKRAIAGCIALTSMLSLTACGTGADGNDASNENNASYGSSVDKPLPMKDNDIEYVDLNDGRIVKCWNVGSGGYGQSYACDFDHPDYKNDDARKEWLKKNAADLKDTIDGLGLTLNDFINGRKSEK